MSEKKQEIKINKNMLRERAKKLDEITDEKWMLVNSVNREMFDEFLNINKHLSTKTIRQYNTCLKQFFWFVYEDLKDKPFYKITKRDFMKYLSIMQERKLSSSAIGLRKSAVSSFCNYIENIVAEDMEECAKFRNFTRGMPSLGKTECYEKIPVSEEEYKKVVKVLEERKNYLGLAWVATAFNVGGRRAEIIQFKTEIFNYEIKKNKNGENGYILSHVVRGKGKGSEGKALRYMINLEAIKYMKLWVDNRGYESDYIFTSRYGGEVRPISIGWANEFCKNVISPILGRRINPHLFKSSLITRMLEAGKPMKLVSEKIGHHKNQDVTMNHYDLRNYDDEVDDLFDL